MIFITSYPYVGARHLKVFQSFTNKNDLVFILPESWPMKDGKVMLHPDVRSGLNIVSTQARFFHSHYFLLRGLMKGWMPATQRILRDKGAKAGDILYTVNEPNLLVTLLNARIARRLGMKHVFFTWQNVSYETRLAGAKLALTRWLIKKNIQASVGAVCGNEKAKEILTTYAPKDFKLLVNPVSGIDLDSFRPEGTSTFRAEHNVEGKTILLFVGAMDNRKGLNTLIEAFAQASSKYENLHLVMIGEGPMKENLKLKIRNLKLEGVVTILPWFDNEKLPAVMSSADMFIYPSEPYGGWEEQFGYSAAEASACGLPVITTKVGSLPDIIKDSVTGIVVPPANSGNLAEAIMKLANDRDLRRVMGFAGREHIAANYGHAKVAEKLENFLRSL